MFRGWIPDNIRKFRQERNLTQKQLSEKFRRFGMTKTTRTINSWERGETKPRADELNILSIILEKPIEYFFAVVSYHTGIVNRETIENIQTSNV